MKTESVNVARLKSETSKALVDKLQEENILLKSRMCEVLSNSISPSLLGSFEEFQNKFIREDEMLKMIRYNILELDNMLNATSNHGDKMNGAVTRKMKQIEDNTRMARNRLTELKSSFHRFLTVNDCG